MDVHPTPTTNDRVPTGRPSVGIMNGRCVTYTSARECTSPGGHSRSNPTAPCVEKAPTHEEMDMADILAKITTVHIYAHRKQNKTIIAAPSSSFPSRVGQLVRPIRPAQTQKKQETEIRSRRTSHETCMFPAFPAFLKSERKMKRLARGRGGAVQPGRTPNGRPGPTCHPVSALISPAQGGTLPPARAGSLAIRRQLIIWEMRHHALPIKDDLCCLRRCSLTAARSTHSRIEDDSTRCMGAQTYIHTHRDTHVHNVVELCTDEN